MSKYRHLELLSRGSVTGLRILDHRPAGPENVAELAAEWTSVADHADCRTLVVDFSNLQFLSSEMLSRLILLQRRLKEKNAKLILTGLRAEVREVLSWTRLDRFFEITEDEDQEAVSLA
jgi:anti-sigma B factor antagonist